jgi:hypothetical protein
VYNNVYKMRQEDDMGKQRPKLAAPTMARNDEGGGATIVLRRRRM